MNPDAITSPEAADATSTGNQTADAAIEVRDLRHQYRSPKRRRGSKGEPAPTRPALDGVSFTVHPGEIFGILGPNGGGKSTLFRILSTMLRPSSPQGTGSASIFGHDVVNQPQAVRERLGVVFQYPSIDRMLTARENLVHQGRLYGLGGASLNQRIDFWLDQFGLTDRMHDRTEHFSGGMRRRVELAKALLHEPRLLLMDEPSTGLDVAARRDLWQHVQRLRDQRGMTIAMTTHLMDEAERCDRLAVICEGRLVAVDKPDRLKAAIGGEVVTVEPADHDDPQAATQLAADIDQTFGPWDAGTAPKVVEGCVRFEKTDGASIVAAIANKWPGRVKRLSVGQPTLEDVFLHLTGQRLGDDA